MRYGFEMFVRDGRARELSCCSIDVREVHKGTAEPRVWVVEMLFREAHKGTAEPEIEWKVLCLFCRDLRFEI